MPTGVMSCVGAQPSLQAVGCGGNTPHLPAEGETETGETSQAGTISPGWGSAAVHHRLARDSPGRVVGSSWAVPGGRPQACREAVVSGTRARQWGCPSPAQVSGRSRCRFRRFRPGRHGARGHLGPCADDRLAPR